MREAKGLADREGVVFHQHQSLTAGEAAYDRRRFGKPAMVHFAEQGLIGPNSVFTHMNILDDSEVEAVAAERHGAGLASRQLHVLRHLADRQERLPCAASARNLDRLRNRHRQGLGVRRPRLHRLSRQRANGATTSSPKRSSRCSRSAARARSACGRRTRQHRSRQACRHRDPHARCSPDAQPNVDMVRQLALVSRTKGVDTVICNGEIIVRHGRLARLDEAEIYRLARRSAESVAARAGLKPTAAGRAWPDRRGRWRAGTGDEGNGIVTNVRFSAVSKAYGAGRGDRRRLAGRQLRRVHDHPRTERLRQDDDAVAHRRHRRTRPPAASSWATARSPMCRRPSATSGSSSRAMRCSRICRSSTISPFRCASGASLRAKWPRVSRMRCAWFG